MGSIFILFLAQTFLIFGHFCLKFRFLDPPSNPIYITYIKYGAGGEFDKWVGLVPLLDRKKEIFNWIRKGIFEW